jgi:hypothetical protein
VLLLKISSNISKPNGRAKKYPKIDGSYESVDYENLYFAGTIAHSLGLKKTLIIWNYGFMNCCYNIHLKNRFPRIFRWFHTRISLYNSCAI